jgi:ABC-2 type transport system permease protein
MKNRLRVIIRKELIQALREPRMRVMIFLPPILQLIILGYAVNLDVENSSVGWFDQDRTTASRELKAAFQGSRQFYIAAEFSDERGLQEALDRGQVQIAVRVLPGFARDVARGQTAPVQLILDGTNSNQAGILGGYAGAVVQRFALQMASAHAVPAIGAEVRVWFNPDLRSRNYFIPGVMLNIITLITLMLTAMAIVREKEIGTMEQLMVTPVRPIEIMLGKTVPFAAVGLVDVALATGIALLIFHIPFRGSVLLLGLSSLIYLMTSLGAGIFISTISRTQQQALMSSFFFFMPAFTLSGFAFPLRNMPEPVQWLTLLNPLRYFIEILRGILIKGSGVDILWPQLLALLLLGGVVLVSSTARFHKRLD